MARSPLHASALQDSKVSSVVWIITTANRPRVSMDRRALMYPRATAATVCQAFLARSVTWISMNAHHTRANTIAFVRIDPARLSAAV